MSANATRPPTVTQVVCALACAGLAAVATGPIALANMASPLQAGDQVGEPSAALRSIAVEHEDLLLDLRGLGGEPPAGTAQGLVAISADYRLRNIGAATSLGLIFVAPGLQAGATPGEHATGPRVTLDGTAVPSAPGVATDLPTAWSPPTSTPGIAGRDPVPYGAQAGDVLRFGLSLAPGPHRVSVRYTARPTTYDGTEEPARFWQVGYVLAPARQWASFGGLTATIEVPHGWLAATSPALTRSGDTFRATFNSVPGDSLGVTAQYPAHPASGDLTPPILVGGLVVAAVVGWIAGGWLGRHRMSSAVVLPLSIFGGGALAIVVAFTGLAALSTGVPGDQASRSFNYHNPRGLSALGVAVLTLFGAITICQVAAALGHHRSRRGSKAA